MYSGDPALQLEARRLIEASMFAMQGGRIPHNFVNNTPVFHAISGANQTGPNLFWLDAALVYVANTGDTAWLQRSLTNMTAALGYLTAMYKPSHNLLLAPGPLWIDTLVHTICCVARKPRPTLGPHVAALNRFGQTLAPTRTPTWCACCGKWQTLT